MDDKLTVVVLTNLAGAQPGVIAHAVGGLVNPSVQPPPPKEHKEIKVDPKLFDGYLGRYELAPDFILTITRQGDHLCRHQDPRGLALRGHGLEEGSRHRLLAGLADRRSTGERVRGEGPGGRNRLLHLGAVDHRRD